MQRNNKLKIIIILGMFLSLALGAKAFFGKEDSYFSSNNIQKKITVNDEAMVFQVISEAETVGDFLNEQGIILNEGDQVMPNVDNYLYPNTKVILQRMKNVLVSDNGEDKEYQTLFLDINGFFWEKGIVLEKSDLVYPDKGKLITDDMKIEIIRVEVIEETELEKIKYKTKSEQDDDLGWREEKVVQVGQVGQEEVIYEVVYHNNKEISRKIKSSQIIKDPVMEIVNQGTYIKVGKAHTGIASWYAQPSHLKALLPSITGYYAANPWLPKGSYVKVTNKITGDSIIARINDRGPFGPGRIIDLDKAAFAAIAPLGAGVTNVKMEEILN